MAKNKKIKLNKYSISLLIIILLVTLIYNILDANNFFNNKNVNKDNEIELINCIDGDTANFTKIGKTRFLFIDTPESTNKVEAYGKKAANATCDMLKKAKVIRYEYDGPTTDKYKRTLAWIFVDDKLIQLELAKLGFVKKFYDYKDKYKYEDLIRNNINDIYHIFEGK